MRRREAAGWYDRRSEGLGDAFVELVREATGEVIADPIRFSTLAGGIRYARVQRFPYSFYLSSTKTTCAY